MANKKNTRRALFMSVMSLILCFAMLMGTTFAWFTDSVTSGTNTIQSGNLDMELKYHKGDGNWADVTSGTTLFDADKWEPGHTQVIYLNVRNAGSLAFRYELGIFVSDESAGENKNGEAFNLSDYLEYAVITNSKNFGNTEEGRAEARAAAVAANSVKLNTSYSSYNGTSYPVLFAGKDSGTIAIVVYMPENVGNEANHNGKAPSITLGIQAMATQYEYEVDSFGNQYDQNAEFTGNPVANSIDTKTTSDTNNAFKATSTNGYVSASGVTENPGDPVDINVTDNGTKTENNKTVVNLDINVTGQKKDSIVVITKQLATGLKNVAVNHKGVPMAVLSTETDEGYSYDSATGILTIQTKSFSPFQVVFDAIVKENIDVSISGSEVTVVEGTVTMNMEDMDASGHASRPFKMTSNSTLIINAEGKNIQCGKYGLVDVPAGVENASIVLNGGNYTANTDNGAFIKVRNGAKNINVTLNNVTYKDESDDGFVLHSVIEDLNLQVNGGNYTAASGFVFAGKAAITNATVNAVIFGFECMGETKIDNCTINVSGEVNPPAPNACVAVSNNASATVTNCTLNAEKAEALAIYSSGGTIIATGNTINAARNCGIYRDTNSYPKAKYNMTIDGFRVVSDTTELQTAINDGAANILLQKSENTYTADLYNCSANRNLTIKGQGADTKLNFANQQVRLQLFDTLTISNCNIQRMATKSWGHLVFSTSDNSTGVYTLSNCTFDGVGTQGIYINEDVSGATYNIKNCTFNGDFGNEGAITIQNNKDVNITVNVADCVFNNIPETSHEIFVLYAFDGWTLNAEGITAFCANR